MSNRMYSPEPEQYLTRVKIPGSEGVTADLSIIEFDEHGMFWNLEQLEGTIRLISERNEESDAATGSAFPFGKTAETVFQAFRTDGDASAPSQRYLATHAEGHIDYLISHRAWVEDGEIRLERVPGAFNDTPFWIVRVTPDISENHGDIRNPVVTELARRIFRMKRVYESGTRALMFADPEFRASGGRCIAGARATASVRPGEDR